MKIIIIDPVFVGGKLYEPNEKREAVELPDAVALEVIVAGRGLKVETPVVETAEEPRAQVETAEGKRAKKG